LPADADTDGPQTGEQGPIAPHPAQAVYAELGLPDGVPTLARLNHAARARNLCLPDGRPLVFVAPARPLAAIDYERRVAERGEIATREGNAHDAWNARVWLAFPRSKAALNAIHLASGATASPNARSPRRDAATLFDECGTIAASVDAVFIDRWRRHRWREAFGASADATAASLAVALTGHGLLARLGRPYPGLTAKALVVAVSPAGLPTGLAARVVALDAAAAARLADARRGLVPADLLPLPLAALATWDARQLGDRRFDDLSVFRPLAGVGRGQSTGGNSRPSPGHANVMGR
jgi:hypothetical protein